MILQAYHRHKATTKWRRHGAFVGDGTEFKVNLWEHREANVSLYEGGLFGARHVGYTIWDNSLCLTKTKLEDTVALG